uniref:Ig-like domain-containing protein n=1 Tax=Naja naja TaxID=35670 RepID=A0A8C6VQD9_NAJNA
MEVLEGPEIFLNHQQVLQKRIFGFFPSKMHSMGFKELETTMLRTLPVALSKEHQEGAGFCTALYHCGGCFRRRNPANCHRWAPSISFGASLCSFPGRDQKPESISVVCLLTGFYPPAFYLQWKGGADVISSGVETTKASKQAGDKYLASSYLKLTAAQYEKYESFTCEVTHESKKISKTVSKSGSC